MLTPYGAEITQKFSDGSYKVAATTYDQRDAANRDEKCVGFTNFPPPYKVVKCISAYDGGYIDISDEEYRRRKLKGEKNLCSRFERSEFYE